MAVKVNPSDEEMVTARAEAKAETYWLKAKKASVIPARRRLVKRMASASHRPSAEQKPAKRFTQSEILIGKEAVFDGEENFFPGDMTLFFSTRKLVLLGDDDCKSWRRMDHLQSNNRQKGLLRRKFRSEKKLFSPERRIFPR
ncbi:hypothetical protein WN944_008259 [Citrus x changshan-huyou]|uniref:Uncharacterized protein n=1 Tax=Citrus x changshan-huyou TaxID=2935761 RepID=A0AAP0MPG6_9ROSI